MMGQGLALNEGVIRDDSGVVVNSSPSDYRMQGSLDIPPDIDVVIVEDPAHASTVPMKAKGSMESVNVSVVPSIANAIYNAIGARVRELPMSKERILKALQQ
jgi:CO/xanthine dehydrogenase Mo-binding subunit